MSARVSVTAQRDRARSLARALTAALLDEHGRKCRCGKPSEGDCQTQELLQVAQEHVDLWNTEARQ